MTQLESLSAAELADIAPVGNWKTTWMLAGGAIGAMLGVLAVYLYIRSVEAEAGEALEPRAIKPGAAMQVALAALTAVRQFANLGTE